MPSSLAGLSSSGNLMLGKGQAMFKRFVAGVAPKDFDHLGNCPNLEINLNDDVLEIRSSMTKSAGLLKRVTKNRAIEVTIKGNDYALRNMALVMMGDTSTFTQAGGAVVAEALSGAASLRKGAFYRTLNRSISAVAVKQGATTLVAGTDYVIDDAAAGILHILSTSPTASEVSPVTIDYTGAAISGTALPTIRGGTQTSIQGQLYFLGDPTSGPSYEATFWFVSIAPDSPIALIQDDWGEWGLKLAVQDDSQGLYGGSANEPYYRLYDR